MAAQRNKAEVRTILEGFVDADTRAHAVNAVGETGLNSRLFSILFLGAFVRSTHRVLDRKVLRYFAGIVMPVLEMAQSAWLTELLRIMDPGQARGKKHLTVELCHRRFKECAEFSKDQRAEEKTLYRALMSACKSEGLRDFRNERMFHLDLAKNLQQPWPCGDMQRVSSALCEWYRSVARATTGDEPKFVTETAPRRGRELAMSIMRLCLDSLRWQAVKGPPYTARDYTRYGWSSGEWIDWIENRLGGTPPSLRVRD